MRDKGGQKIGYSAYWRCDAKLCSKCGNTFPLNYFYVHPKTKTGYRSNCKRCDKIKMAVYHAKQKLIPRKLKTKRPSENVEKRREYRKNYIGRITKEEYNYRDKLRRIKRELDKGFSRPFEESRNKRLRFLIFNRTIRRDYGIAVPVETLRAKFLYGNDYKHYFNLWEAGGFLRRDAPSIFPKEDRKGDLIIPKTISDFRIVNSGYVRSYTWKRLWANGVWANRKPARSRES